MTIETMNLPRGVECPDCGAFPCRYTVLEEKKEAGEVHVQVNCIECALRPEIGQAVMVIRVKTPEDQLKNHLGL